MVNFEGKSLLFLKHIVLHDLKEKKVILFGAGRNGRLILEELALHGISPAYFVDNKKAFELVEYCDIARNSVAVKKPESLLYERKQSMVIIITPEEPLKSEIKAQIDKMELNECILPDTITACAYLANPQVLFINDKINFCCGSLSNFNPNPPRFSYLDTAEKTIMNVLQKREEILAELNSVLPINLSKSCTKCDKLGYYSAFSNEKIKYIDISCYPSVCNAKCIYCNVPSNSKSTCANSHSRYPKMIADMVAWLQNENRIERNALVKFSPAEISIMPDKDLVIEAVKRYRTSFLTNGFVFDSKIASAIKRNGILNISLDSGTQETFKLIKGLDLFETVYNNLKKYNNSGELSIKYIIIPGVNDNDDDLDGIIEILETLSISTINISYDFGLPLRSACYSLVKFAEKLDECNISFSFQAYYSQSEIREMIKQYYTFESREQCKERNNELSKTFKKEYTDDYKDYRSYVYYTEIRDLIECFKKETRFALLGTGEKSNSIISSFKKLGIPLQTPNLPYEESYESVKDNADVLIMRDKEEIATMKEYIESSGGDSACLLDIERYYYSFMPVRQFLKHHIPSKYIR